LFEASLYASNNPVPRFQERYLFVLLALLPIAFGLYLQQNRPWRLFTAGVSAVIVVAVARVPVSGYAAGIGSTHSPSLDAFSRLASVSDTGNAALLVALTATAAAGVAVAIAWRGKGQVALGIALALLVLTSIGAAVADAEGSQAIRSIYLPGDRSWVDAVKLRDVTLVQTAGSPPVRAIEVLYWNRSVTREVLLGRAEATDAYPTPSLQVARDGTMVGVGHAVLFQGYGAAATFANASAVRRFQTFTLWWARRRAPRLSLLEQGRYADSWLAASGRLTVWPDSSGRTRGVVHFTLSLPRRCKPVTMRFGRSAVVLRAGEHRSLAYRIDRPGSWSIPFSSLGGRRLLDLRAVSVQSSVPKFVRAPAVG
jgi:hypothetical protein